MTTEGKTYRFTVVLFDGHGAEHVKRGELKAVGITTATDAALLACYSDLDTTNCGGPYSVTKLLIERKE